MESLRKPPPLTLSPKFQKPALKPLKPVRASNMAPVAPVAPVQPVVPTAQPIPMRIDQHIHKGLTFRLAVMLVAQMVVKDGY